MNRKVILGKDASPQQPPPAHEPARRSSNAKNAKPSSLLSDPIPPFQSPPKALGLPLSVQKHAATKPATTMDSPPTRAIPLETAQKKPEAQPKMRILRKDEPLDKTDSAVGPAEEAGQCITTTRPVLRPMVFPDDFTPQAWMPGSIKLDVAKILSAVQW